MYNLIKTQLRTSSNIKQQISENESAVKLIHDISEQCIQAFRSGHKVILAGNGGSASDAQHIAAEFVGRFEKDRAGLPALALATNSSSITAIGNDYGYDAIFQRQVQALAVPGDVFFGFTTSGNSNNIIAAVQECRAKGIASIGMTGESGGSLLELCDYCFCVPSSNTARIQEAHITVGHILCSLVENALFDD